MNLAGRRYLVTGAAGGLGSEIVLRIARDGGIVAATDLDAKALRALFEKVPNVTCVQGDLSRAEEIAEIVTTAEQALGGFDGLVHCAAIGARTALLDCSLDVWSRIQTVNLTSTFHLCQLVARKLASQKAGVLIALASGAGLRPNAGNIPYGASKAGLIGLMRAVAVDLAPFGVRANVVVPGPVDTPLMRSIAGSAVPLLEQRTMLGRLGRPHEIAGAVAFLLSDEACYVTGAVLCADGGFSNSGLRFTPAAQDEPKP